MNTIKDAELYTSKRLKEWILSYVLLSLTHAHARTDWSGCGPHVEAQGAVTLLLCSGVLGALGLPSIFP